VTVTASTLGAFPGANDKDKKERIPAAVNALNRALAGDTSVLSYMTAQSQGSATAVGKEAFRRALAYYSANKPAAPSVTAAPAPLAPTPAAPSGTTQGPKPTPIAGVSVPGAQSLPIGFNPGEVLIDPVVQNSGGFGAAPFGWLPGRPAPAGYHIVAAGTRSEHIEADRPGISIHGVTPGIITPVKIGRPRIPHVKPAPVEVGGVMTGPPVDTLTADNKAPASADFGYVAPSTSTAIAAATDTTTPPAGAPTSTTNAGLLLGVAAGILLLIVVTKGKGGDFHLWK
jgi:hypothetical protein